MRSRLPSWSQPLTSRSPVAHPSDPLLSLLSLLDCVFFVILYKLFITWQCSAVASWCALCKGMPKFIEELWCTEYRLCRITRSLTLLIREMPRRLLVCWRWIRGRCWLCALSNVDWCRLWIYVWAAFQIYKIYASVKEKEKEEITQAVKTTPHINYKGFTKGGTQQPHMLGW